MTATALNAATTATGLSTAPDYAISVEPLDRHVVGKMDGVVIVDSKRALVLRETRHAPMYYFPREDINMDALSGTTHMTHCPFKGDAVYWSVMASGRVIENMAWSYETPLPEVAEIAGYIAFYNNKMGSWYEDGVCVSPPGADKTDMAVANPLVSWAIGEAWEAATSRELTMRLVRQLNEAGVRLTRANVVLQTLHPLIVGTSYRWDAGNDYVERREFTQAMRDEHGFENSPVASVFAGMGGVRRWVGSDNPADDYPILQDLRAAGATDYVAMPMRFSDGQINAITLATDHPDGFSTQYLGWIHEILPTLSRYHEVHANRRKSSTLMQTFLGRHTGQRVLDGLVQRGDGEDIHAVIWFCDLRNSTPIADSLGRQAFLDYVNRFFDCMAGAVLENEGEVLHFIGDAVLAIFPIANPDNEGARKKDWVGDCPIKDATTRAAEAAREAARRVDKVNRACEHEGLPCIGYGIGMHVGSVTYGNIGTADRLAFTVIGAAANEAARVEGMTKNLKQPVIVSQEFRDSFAGDLDLLGEFELRGVGAAKNLYALNTL